MYNLPNNDGPSFDPFAPLKIMLLVMGSSFMYGIYSTHKDKRTAPPIQECHFVHDKEDDRIVKSFYNPNEYSECISDRPEFWVGIDVYEGTSRIVYANETEIKSTQVRTSFENDENIAEVDKVVMCSLEDMVQVYDTYMKDQLQGN